MIKPHPLKIYLMVIGMSQSELARKARLDRSKVNLFLNGRFILSEEEINKLCKVVSFDSIDEIDAVIGKIIKKN